MRIRVTRCRAVHLAAGAAVMLAPAAIANAASAATLQVNRACYVVSSKHPPVMVVTGTGYGPGDVVAISSGSTAIANGQAHADATGAISVGIPIVPVKTTVIPQTTKLTAQDFITGATATTSATVALRAAFHGATPKAPGLRALTEKTKWQFSGFAPGRSIWGHYTIGHRQVARQRFGKAKGPCGTLTVRKVLYPGRPHHSSYPVQIDQQKRYSRKTKVKVSGRVSLHAEF